MVMDLHTDKSIGEVLTDVIPCVAADRMLHTMRIYMAVSYTHLTLPTTPYV